MRPYIPVERWWLLSYHLLEEIRSIMDIVAKMAMIKSKIVSDIHWQALGLLFPMITYQMMNKIDGKNIRRLYERKDISY